MVSFFWDLSTDDIAMVSSSIFIGIFTGVIAWTLLAFRFLEGIFLVQAAVSFGSMIAGIILDVIRFPTGENVQTTDIDINILNQFELMYILFILFFTIIALWCCNHYDLSHERHTAILKKLHDKII